MSPLPPHSTMSTYTQTTVDNDESCNSLALDSLQVLDDTLYRIEETAAGPSMTKPNFSQR